jgi:PAS domain S-box-containing protein
MLDPRDAMAPYRDENRAPHDGQPNAARVTADQREWLELALDSGNMGAFSWDRARDLVTWDHRLSLLFGVEPGRFGGTFDAWIERVHPDDRAAAMRVVGRALETKSSFAFDHRVRHDDGTIRWIEGRGHVMLDESGEVAGVRGVAVDITDRKTAELQLVAAQRRLRLLVRASGALATSLDVDTVLRRVGALIVPELADAFEVALITDSGALERRTVVLDDERAEAPRRERPVPLVEYHPFHRVVRDATPITIDIELEPEAFGPVDDPTSAAGLGMRTGVIAPLVADQRVLGVLSLGRRGERDSLVEIDVPFVSALADRVAAALERCRLYERERRTATRLQRALLPSAVPVIDGVEIAVRYRPGVANIAVGGDWYDVVGDGDGVWISIGDVMGSGLEAAALMGSVRSMLHALTFDERSPARALSRLGKAVFEMPQQPFVTAALCRVEHGHGTMRFARAGHPPPAVVTRDGRVSFVGTAQPPLGVPAAGYHDEVVDVPPGASVVLYTDGLVERSGEDIDDGLARLATAATRLRGESVERFADELLDAVVAPHATDDIALVVLRVARTDSA